MSLYHKPAWLALMLLPSLLQADQSDPKAVELLQKSEALMRSSKTVAEYQVDIIRPD